MATNQVDTFNWSVAEADDNSTEESGGFNVFLCFRVLLSYWWVISILAMIGAGLGLSYCIFIAQPVYRAYCRFEIFQNSVDGQKSTPYGTHYKPNLWRHILLMRSRKLNEDIREQLRIEWGNGIPKKFNRYHLDIRPAHRAPESILDISMNSFDPKYSVSYLRELIAGYEQLRHEETDLLHSNALSRLRKEYNTITKELEDVQNQISQFETEHNIYFVREKSKSDQELLSSLMRYQSRLRSQIAILDAQFPILQDENAATLRDVLDLTNQLSSVTPSLSSGDNTSIETTSRDKNSSRGWSEIPEWRKNETLIMRLNSEYAYLLKTYKSAHPKMEELKEKIDAAKRELQISSEISLKRLYSIRSALKMQEKALLETAKKFRMGIELTGKERAEYEKMRVKLRYLEEKRNNYDSLILDNQISPSDQYYSRVIEGPVGFESSVWPVKWRIIMTSCLSLTGIGAGLILLSYFIKVRLYDFQSLERSLNLTCLTGIPRFKIKRSFGKTTSEVLNVLKDKGDFASECYRTLRTNIEQTMKDHDKILLVTSPDPGEGKTFTTLNLATVFSWSGKKVLIIDGDFRRRTLRRIFKDKSKIGLTNYLSSENSNWQEAVLQSPIPGVDYLPAGKMNQNITELLTMPRIKEILNQIRHQYDMVFIDSAPVNRVVDTVVLAKYADMVLLVAKAAKTKVHSMRYCYSRLSASNIIGYVLNHIDSSSKKFSYYNQYSYPYYSTYHQYKTYYNEPDELGKRKEVEASSAQEPS